MELTIVEGGKSALYNHFSEYVLASCRATKTRLMGVVALKLAWHDPDDAKKRFYQVIHLDYSEYGIDEYLEFDCDPNSPDYEDLRGQMQDSWNRFIRIMGGSAVDISPACMLRLIESALEFASEDREREYDSEENKSFRKHAKKRLAMMNDVLRERGITAEDCSVYDSIDACAPVGIGQYGTINYFLMRLLDRDFDAAEFLSGMPRKRLEASELASHGVQTLMKTSISKSLKKEKSQNSEKYRKYNCHLTSLSRDGYYYTSLSIWLDGGWTSRDALVMDMDIGSSNLLSEYEAAIQIARNEYVTVFEFKREMAGCPDTSYIQTMTRANRTECGNGILYTIYNESNEHVEKKEYILSDDVYGYALFTLQGELILMSHDLTRISTLDENIVLSVFAPYVRVKGRYHMDTPIFHALCHTTGLIFEDLIEPDE